MLVYILAYWRLINNLTINLLPTMSNNGKTSLRGRDADNGRFTTVEEARRHRKDHVVERVPKPGYGDTK